MFQLKYLECQDFFSFDNVSIRFTKGMTLITGYDELGKDSNGCGKSTILNAVCWALFGRTLKGVQGQDVIRWGCKNCKIILILEGEGHTYEITRSLNNLSFKIDNTLVRGHHRDIQSSIETAFKTNFALFIRSTAFSQSQVEFLGAAGDAEKKKLFKEILSLSRLDKAYDKIKVQYDLQSGRAERLEGELEAINWQRNNLGEKIRSTEELQITWEKNTDDKIKALLERKNKRPADVEKLSLEVDKLKKAWETDSLIEDDISLTEKKVYELSFDEERCSKEVDRLWEVINKGQDRGQQCELCGSVVNKKMLGAHKRELEERIADLKGQSVDLIKDKKEIQNHLQDLYRMRIGRDKLKSHWENKQRELASTIMEWEYYKEMCVDVDRQTEEVKNSGNPYDGILGNFNSEFNDIITHLVVLQTDFENTKKLIDTLSFVKFTLSREGAVGHIIEREYSTLMSYANRLLSEISGGHLRLSISPQRELKSGAIKEEIEIVVYSNEQRTTYWGLSDGQRQRVNIALLLALNKLCKMKGVNSFDFMLLDEVLDLSLAEGGQQDVLSLLKNYLRECSTIVLISHKETFKASFQSCLSIYRDREGISHLGR